MYNARDVVELCQRLSIPVFYSLDEDKIPLCLNQRLLYNSGRLGGGFHGQTKNLDMIEKHNPSLHLRVTYHNSNSR